MTASLSAGSDQWQVSVHRHIDEIDAAEWDFLLDPADVQLSHRFVKICEDAGVEQAEHRHVLLYDSEGLAGIASFSFMEVSLELLTSRRLRRTVQAVRRRRPTFWRIPVLFCGLPVSFGRPCVKFRTGSDTAAGVRTLCGLMRDAGRELQAEVLCFKEFSPTEAQEVDDVRGHGYFRASSLPSCILPVRWNTFDDYLGAMRHGYRRQVLSSKRRGRQAGLEVRLVEDFDLHCADIFRLYGEVMDRAEFQLERLNLPFFRLLNRYLPNQAKAILASLDEKLVAFALVLDAGGKSSFLLAGVDYELNRECDAYLNVVTEVVAHAIAQASNCVEMGQASYTIKRRLGAECVPRYVYIRHRTHWTHELLRRGRKVFFPTREYPRRRVFRNL